jgi:hypothetical protein|nr:hypothetical protein [Kofleriaceae bacterium]
MLDRITPKQPLAPTRAPVVLAALLVQLGAAACLVIGLAAIPMVHDLRQDPVMLAGWIGTALLALVCGGLAYRARLVPLFVAAIACAALGFVLPRGDSAIGVVAKLLPKGDIPESIVVYASIAMFAIGAMCLAVLPWAVPYRAWDRGDDAEPKQTLYGMAVAVPLAAAQSLRMLAAKRRPWMIVCAVGVIVGVAGGFALVHLFGSGAQRADAATPRAEPVDKPAAAQAAAAAPQGGAATPQLLIAAVMHAGSAADLAPLLAADAIAIGTEAADVTTGRAAAAALVARELAHDAGHALSVGTVTVATDGSVAWIAQDLSLAGLPLELTAVAHEELGHWTVAALALAQPLSNDAAAHLAKTKQLAALAPLPAAPASAAELAAAARDAFASPVAFADAVSVRSDALEIARHGERTAGGDVIRRGAIRMTHAKFAVGQVAAGHLGARAGWTVVTVTETNGSRSPEPMRVLAAWVHEDTGWRIVQAQWSNGGPFHS